MAIHSAQVVVVYAELGSCDGFTSIVAFYVDSLTTAFVGGFKLTIRLWHG